MYELYRAKRTNGETYAYVTSNELILHAPNVPFEKGVVTAKGRSVVIMPDSIGGLSIKPKQNGWSIKSRRLVNALSSVMEKQRMYSVTISSDKIEIDVGKEIAPFVVGRRKMGITSTNIDIDAYLTSDVLYLSRKVVKDYSHVQLYLDRKRGEMAVKLLKEPTKVSLKIQPSGKKFVRVYVKPFLKWARGFMDIPAKGEKFYFDLMPFQDLYVLKRRKTC